MLRKNRNELHCEYKTNNIQCFLCTLVCLLIIEFLLHIVINIYFKNI